MWEKKKLGDIAKLKNGFAFKSKDYSDEGIPVIRISDIKDNLVTTTKAKRVPMENEYEECKIEEGSILIAMSGATTGKFGIYKSKEVALQNQRVGKFTYDKNQITNKFLYYLLYNLKREILKEAYGGAQPNISSKKIEEMEVSLPPLPAQHQIVEKIEELFSDLDNGIENLQKAKQQLESYKQAILKAAFEGKLTKEWREQQDNLPIPAELKQQIEKERKQYREQQLKEWQEEVKQWEEDGEPGRRPRKPRKIAKVSPIEPKNLKQLPSIPKSWNWTRIGEIGKVGTGSTPLKKKKSAYYDGGKVPWVTSGALNNWYVRKASDFVTKKALEETNLTVYSKHTLLVAMYGEGKTRGKCSELLIEACTNQAVAAIVQEETEAKTKPFLKYFFLKNYNEIRRKSSGGVQPNLNLGIIRATLVPLPPLREQDQIVEELESRLSIVRQIEKTVTNELQKSEALRQSILKKAFEGKLVQ